MQNNTYNPDVLSCLANLSNDEVFTPPALANQMLDLLPNELWSNPDAKFLDPCCKSGVFLREIAKRLIIGLKSKFPDLQDRLNHIYTNQLYGIAITEMTALLSRRSVYCSKTANGKYSVCDAFKDTSGNIVFQRTEHTWVNGRCQYCGASQSEYDRDESLETHAYQFIHADEVFNMKFDVIIGNPPYQLSVGNDGGNSSKAKSIYHLFVEQAIKLNPRYLTMIIPSRWMTRTTEGIPDEWIDSVLTSNSFRTIHDFEASEDCFPGVSIMGGVNYFLWDRDYKGSCQYIYHYAGDNSIAERTGMLDPNGLGFIIRDPKSHAIIHKIEKIEGDYSSDESNNFSGLVSPKDFFTNKQSLTSSWDKFSDTKNKNFNIKYYLNKQIHKREYGWVAKDQVPKNHQTIPLHKVIIPTANGSMDVVLGQPFYGEPNSVCSQTYLVIGYDPEKHNFNKTQCENIVSYIKTRFFRYLVSIKKKTQNGPRGVYQFVPMQDFNESWDDKKLYKKYGLTQKEIAFIESMVRPME